MSRIHTLKIYNYRGIEHFEHVFNNQFFVCLIGRGDSGKTTILDAIHAVLSPRWDYRFYDTDFHNGDTTKPIVIEVSLQDLPPELLSESKFGLYKRILNPDNEIVDYFSEEESGCSDILTIRLVVHEDLEPTWYVVNDRKDQDNIEISAGDRAKFNVFLVSDYIDRHFSWGKGSPLYALLKKNHDDIDTDRIIVDANRKAYDNINNTEAFASFSDIVKSIQKSALSLGLSVDELKVLIDFKNLLVKEGSITLHDESNIPFRLKGKGTRRLLSIAIQLDLIKYEGGIILIDEIEQGLEPDRVKFLVNRLKQNNQGQIFITTHSNNVIVELEAKDIFLKKNDNRSGLFSFNDNFQGCIRNNPNAFFAKRLIVCEGETEVGICRALNNHRINNGYDNLELNGISLVNGTGNNFVDYCLHFRNAGFDVCAFCDSDNPDINSKKTLLQEKGVKVIDCDQDNAIEQQIFNDLPWNKVQELLEYAIELKGAQSISAQLSIDKIDSLEESAETRRLIGNKAKGKQEKGWFKRIEYGEVLGCIWFDSLHEMDDNKRLKCQYKELMFWIDRK